MEIGRLGLSFSSVIFLYLIIGVVIAAPSCAFRSSCNAGEICLFSVFQGNNSHVGACNYYSTQVCCNETVSASLRSGACNSNEGIVFSQYQQNNSHVGGNSYFNNKLCTRFSSNPSVTNLRSSCLSGEACVASIYQQNNSHVGQCNYYSNQLCMRELFNVSVSINLNNTAPGYSQWVHATGTATRADGSFVDTNPNALSIYVNGTQQCVNETDANGNYACDFLSPNALGNYQANVTIQDPLTSAYWSNVTSFQVVPSVGQANVTSTQPQSISCYEEPRVIQNPDGSLTIANVRICIWK